jgi:hypothetical protein
MQRFFARALVESANKQKYLAMSRQIPAYVDLEEARSHAKLVRGFGLDGETKVKGSDLGIIPGQ